MKITREGILFCLCGPTGAGKTTIANYLIENFPPCEFSVSVTSRDPRPGEVEGKSYHFVTPVDFKSKVKEGAFFEHEVVHGNFYGTLKKTVHDSLGSGIDLLLDIDIKGALNFKQNLPNNTVVVFVTPPSIRILKERLLGRGKITEADLAKRLGTAKTEFQTVTTLCADNKVDYFVVNDEIGETLTVLSKILQSERNRLLRFSAEDVKQIYKEI